MAAFSVSRYGFLHMCGIATVVPFEETDQASLHHAFINRLTIEVKHTLKVGREAGRVVTYVVNPRDTTVTRKDKPEVVHSLVLINIPKPLADVLVMHAATQDNIDALKTARNSIRSTEPEVPPEQTETYKKLNDLIVQAENELLCAISEILKQDY